MFCFLCFHWRFAPPLPLQRSYGFKVSTSTVHPQRTDWRFSHTDELLRRQKRAHLLRIRSRRSTESESLCGYLAGWAVFGGQVTFVNLDGEAVNSCFRARRIVPEWQDGKICHSQKYIKCRKWGVTMSSRQITDQICRATCLLVGSLFDWICSHPVHFSTLCFTTLKTKQSLCPFWCLNTQREPISSAPIPIPAFLVALSLAPPTKLQQQTLR